MFGMSMTELLVIGVLALIVFGPERIPGIARKLGRTVREVRRAAMEVQRAFEIEDIRQELKVRNTTKPKVSIRPMDALKKSLLEEAKEKKKLTASNSDTPSAATPKPSNATTQQPGARIRASRPKATAILEKKETPCDEESALQANAAPSAEEVDEVINSQDPSFSPQAIGAALAVPSMVLQKKEVNEGTPSAPKAFPLIRPPAAMGVGHGQIAAEPEPQFSQPEISFDEDDDDAVISEALGDYLAQNQAQGEHTAKAIESVAVEETPQVSQLYTVQLPPVAVVEEGALTHIPLLTANLEETSHLQSITLPEITI